MTDQSSIRSILATHRLKATWHSFQWQLYPSFGFSYSCGYDNDFDLTNHWLIIGPLQMRWRT